MQKLVECVPNFSEGKDAVKIKEITDAIKSVEGITLLNVDPGADTNRTVVTFVGSPDAVTEAAFRGIEKAAQVIDMSKHKGKHPRMGATDVCPIIPLRGVTLEEAIDCSKKLAERVGRELNIPVYLYEFSQPNPERKNLSIIRAGEYEGFFRKIKESQWKPDFGPDEFRADCGATVIGVRNFLIAYNVNLNTRSTRLANSVAFDIRENGRIKRIGNPYTGKIEKDENGNEVRIPGLLKECKAIGWYIDEYKIAQVSINLTNPGITSVHHAFDACCESAARRGLRVTGSELVGLIPLDAMLEAGRHYLKKQKRSLGVSEDELIHIAIKSMGLDELAPFNPQEKIIEYKLKKADEEKLIAMSIKQFAYATAGDSPAPGGGSVAACTGALGVALGTMVANLSAAKRGWEEKTAWFSEYAEKGQYLCDQLLSHVDKDTNSFNAIMEAFALPKSTDEEKALRTEAIELATRYAVEVPFRVMQLAFQAIPVVKAMVESGNPNGITDAGAGALCLRACVQGAYMNVLINATGLKNKEWAQPILDEAAQLADKAESEVQEISHHIIQHIFSLQN